MIMAWLGLAAGVVFIIWVAVMLGPAIFPGFAPH
jgi:hypothetical protein